MMFSLSLTVRETFRVLHIFKFHIHKLAALKLFVSMISKHKRMLSNAS